MAAGEQVYLRGVDPLVAGGAAAGNLGWNISVAGVANSNDKIIAVDRFTAFNRIYERSGV